MFSESRLFVQVGNGEQFVFTVSTFPENVVTSFYSGFHDQDLDQDVDAITIFDLRLMCSRGTRSFARSSASGICSDRRGAVHEWPGHVAPTVAL